MSASQAWPRSWAALLVLLGALGAAGCSDELAPRIIALLPASAPTGATVEIVGERFAGQQRTVAFGGHAAAQLTQSDTRLTVRVPGGLSGLTIVVVQVDGRPSNAVDFYVDSPPADGGAD